MISSSIVGLLLDALIDLPPVSGLALLPTGVPRCFHSEFAVQFFQPCFTM